MINWSSLCKKNTLNLTSRWKRWHLMSPQSLRVSSAARSHFTTGHACYWLPSLSFHDNQASHSWDTIWPWNFKVKGKGQRYPKQCSIPLTPLLSVLHQVILSSPIPPFFMTIGPFIPEIQFDLENSRSKVKVKDTPVSPASSWLIS